MDLNRVSTRLGSVLASSSQTLSCSFAHCYHQLSSPVSSAAAQERAKMAAEQRKTPSGPGASAAGLNDDEDTAAVAFRALDFEPGAEVEVRRNEEGFPGTWYEAAVLRRLPARQRYDVVYASRISEKGPSGRLQERVNCNYVRPRPPLVADRRGHQFRLHDRVEVFFKDGWWFGIVSGVLPSPAVGRYIVCLPTRREEMEFGHSELRPQLHWDNEQRRWIPVEEMRLRETGKPMFGVGDRVEASRNVKDYGAAWFSAIVLKVLDINTFFVEYEKVKKTDNKGEVLKEILDVQHMRPALPAEPRVMDFIVGVKVEVLVHGGWSPGTVLATFGMGKHVVKLMNCGRNSLYQYDSAKMRHQRVWNGSRWVHNYKKNPQKLQDVGGGDKSPTMKQKDDARFITPASSSASEDMQADNENPPKLQDVGGGDKSPTMKQKDDARFITPASSSASEDMQADNENPPKLQDVDGDESPATKEKSSCIAPASLLASGEMHLDGYASGMSQSLQHLATADTNASTTGNQADHMEATCPTLVEEPFVSMKSCSFNIKHTEAPKFFDLPDSAEKHISASPCKEGTAVNEESVQTRSTLKAATVNASPLKNVPLPFVKGSLMWESIESMEVFSKMPQEPHFHPLEEYCMDLREGMAIGLMISFVNLVSSVQKLSISDAQIEIETRLKALEQLEENGFNVSCLRMRLNELLQMQLSYKQNETRKAMLQTKMLKMEVETNHDELNASLDKAIGGLEQSIAYFREKKNSMMKQKAIYESEIVKIQLETQEVEEAYRSTEENFKLRVAAPLR